MENGTPFSDLYPVFGVLVYRVLILALTFAVGVLILRAFLWLVLFVLTRPLLTIVLAVSGLYLLQIAPVPLR